jgi:hypothetical protein
MARIFISYRRADSMTITGRIHDRLVDAFGDENVFKDVDNLPIGVDFRSVINREIGSSDVLLVIIGPNWVNATDEYGQRRLDTPTDFVRIEVELALRRKTLLIVPLLVNGAMMPTEDQLPEPIRDLVFRHAAIVRDDPDFRRDIARLIEQITKYVSQDVPTTQMKRPAELRPPAPPPVAPPSTPSYDEPTSVIRRVGTGPLADSRPRPPEGMQEVRTAAVVNPPPAPAPQPAPLPPSRGAIDPRWMAIAAVFIVALVIIALLLLSRG